MDPTSPPRHETLDRLCVTTLRMLAVDQVEKANSGHPGMPLGAAPMAFVLWHRVMRHNPTNPQWLDRDRFILSAGHGSSLLYGLLHLSGYDLQLDELKRFRQLGSRTPGHPECGVTPGVEATTGPLGQGFAMGVGMAIAERRLAQTFNRGEYLPIVDHFTYAIVSDGDLMVGIGSEAASLAGHLCLGKLIYLYDDNRITIEGSTDLTFTEDVKARFEAYHWHVVRVEDGEDLDAIEAAIREAQREEERPSLIMVRTHIGHGSPLQDTSSVHGAPLGAKAMAETRRYYQWPETTFHVPDEVRDRFRTIIDRGRDWEAEWEARLLAHGSRYPEDVDRLRRQSRGELPAGWDQGLAGVDLGLDAPIATRIISGRVINALAPHLPALMGGSADLSPSIQSSIAGDPDRNIHFGVREHAMGAISNGMALHGGILPYCSTFLSFSDYLRPAMRMAALMRAKVVYVFSHDSIAVGEDGPTHQPTEQLSGLRALPGLFVLRPADGSEAVAAWRYAITSSMPVALVFSRQPLPPVSRATTEDVARGAYVLSDCEGVPDLVFIASGGEVQLVLGAQAELAGRGIRTRVVSMPCRGLFDRQPESYRDSVVPPGVKKRLAVEAGSSLGWHRWVGDQGSLLTIDAFGISGQARDVLEHFGFTVPGVVRRALKLLGK
ncbi:MAG: transketolase [Magnetococcales bacterium]|nr:transketolase [Magnetococcales bacterium]MBF0156252.1 transketolase [Magnetococcales bacterium]